MLLGLTAPRRRQLGKVSVGGLMLGLWLVTWALTASPHLHQLLHSDAQRADHYCLFTQLSEHSITASSGFVVACQPEPLATRWVHIDDFELLPSFDFVISDGRAPPCKFSSNAVVG